MYTCNACDKNSLLCVCECVRECLMNLYAAEVLSIKNTNLYTYKELRMATDNFDPANKIGEGGFGSVYKVSAHFISFSNLLKGL